MDEGGCWFGPEVVNDAKRLRTSDLKIRLGSLRATSEELWSGKLGERVVTRRTLAGDHYHE